MNNIEPKYVTFEQAKWLKEIGFNLPTLNWYHKGNKKFNTNDLLFSMNKLTDNYSAPEQWQIIEFLRINHGIWVFVGREPETGVYYPNIDVNKGDKYFDKFDDYDTPQKAYSAAINYIKDNNLI